MKIVRCILALCAVVAAPVAADGPAEVEAAVRLGLARVKQSASDWQTHKTCFSCHHQTLPMLAMTEAARVGFPLDNAWLNSQATTTHTYFEERIEDMNKGNHVPGGATTAGYGLWALEMAKRPADVTTTAIIIYLSKIQGMARLQGREPADLSRVASGRWTTSCRRPPMQGSDIADTVLALIGMEKYATKEQMARLTPSRTAAAKWLSQAPLVTHEDRIWRLWGLHYLKGDEASIQTVRDALVKTERPDGGWSASDGLGSDAFSTGETLFVLTKTGTTLSEPMVQRARDYLLRTQHADGSWLVKSRVKNKAQPYFENGDPHGEHQFISTAATAWAVAGLAQLLPSKP